MCCSESHIFILFLCLNLVGGRKSVIGVTLTISQWEFYLQVYDILSKSDVRFSKRDLKAFIHWIFKYFMDITWESVLLVEFWDKVWNKLYFQQSKADFWVGKFYLIFCSSYEVIEDLGKSSGNVKVQYPSCFSSYCLPPPVFLFPHPLRRCLEMENVKMLLVFCHLSSSSVPFSGWH